MKRMDIRWAEDKEFENISVCEDSPLWGVFLIEERTESRDTAADAQYNKAQKGG